MPRRWAPLAIAAAGVVLLALSRFIFARPKPSPLDPMFARMRQVGPERWDICFELWWVGGTSLLTG